MRLRLLLLHHCVLLNDDATFAWRGGLEPAFFISNEIFLNFPFKLFRNLLIQMTDPNQSEFELCGLGAAA